MKTTFELIEILKDECNKHGKYVYTNKRKAVEEMLRMRGENISKILESIN